MNYHALNKTIAKICKCAVGLPEGIGVLTNEELPISPVFGLDGKSVSYWVVYIQKRGTGEQPEFSKASFDSDGIAELGNGWKLGRVRVNDSQIGFGNTVVELINDVVTKIQKRDPAQEN